MTEALGATDQLGILPHLVERYSTAEQPASYIIEGALDTEVRVTFKYGSKSVVGVGKTLQAAATDVREKLLVAQATPVAEVDVPPKANPHQPSRAPNKGT